MTWDTRFGTTLFSFTNEWMAGAITLEEIMAAMSHHDLGPGIELVGYQTVRGFPEVDAGFAARFAQLVAQNDLEPSALAIDLDVARRSDRFMTTGESVAAMRAGIAAAVALGFGVLGTALGLATNVIEQLAGDLERAGVTLVLELQGPLDPQSAVLHEAIEVLQRLDTPALGFLLDFSVAGAGVPVSFLDHLRRLGSDEALLSLLDEVWAADGAPHERFERFAAHARALGSDEGLITAAHTVFVRLAHQAPGRWADVMPFVRHAHAKFWDLLDPEVHIDPTHAAFFGMLRDVAFDGVISSEWGGSQWLDTTDVSSMEMVARHLDRCRRLVANMSDDDASHPQE